MEYWKLIISFTYPHEAHIAKSLLEEQDVEVLLRDEATSLINNPHSVNNGVKLMVKESNYVRAYRILCKAKYIKEVKLSSTYLDKKVSKYHIINRLYLETKLFSIIIFFGGIICLPILLFIFLL